METGVLGIYILLTKGDYCLEFKAVVRNMTVRYIYFSI